MLRQLKVWNKVDEQVIKLVHRMPLKLQQLNHIFLLHGVVMVHRRLLQLLIRFEVRISDHLLQFQVTNLLRTIIPSVFLLFFFVDYLAHESDTLYNVKLNDREF